MSLETRRQRWLLEVHRRTIEAQRRRADDAAAERGVEFRVRTYEAMNQRRWVGRIDAALKGLAT